jgi:hypothetical protein
MMIRDYDLSTASGQQEFQRWVVEIIRNEVNSYARQVLADRASTANIADGSLLSDTERIERLERTIFRG